MWSGAVRSGDLAGQAMPPEREVTCPCNTAVALSNVPRAVWAVAPSCWDQGAPVTCDVFCSTGYRAEVSVAVRLPSSESEFQYFQTPTLHSQLCSSIPHTHCVVAHRFSVGSFVCRLTRRGEDEPRQT